jgi:hypothetical protein
VLVALKFSLKIFFVAPSPPGLWTSQLFLFNFGYRNKVTSMKILLDIKDDKAPFIIELLNNFKFVKTQPLTSDKAEAIEGLRHAIQQVNDDKRGKIRLKSARQLLDEL